MPVLSGTSSVASILPSLGKPLVPQVLSETRAIGGKGICYVFIRHWTYLSFLSYLPYHNPIPVMLRTGVGSDLVLSSAKVVLLMLIQPLLFKVLGQAGSVGGNSIQVGR